MPHVARLDVYPIKALDGVRLEAVPIAAGGRIAFDREYAMFDAAGEYVNGKNNDLVYRLRAAVDVETGTVTLEAPEVDPTEFDVEEDRDELDAWLSSYFGEPVEVLQATDRNFNDSAGGMAPMKLTAPGPTVVSTATIEEVASWFDGLTADGIRRRIRTNIEIGGVEPFWEDRLFAGADRVVEFEIGGVTLHGVMPKPRCRVPAIDPATGERHDDFIRVFTENREAKFPGWADADDLGAHIDLEVEHYYYLTVVTRIPRTEVGATISEGDAIDVVGEKATFKVL